MTEPEGGHVGRPDRTGGRVGRSGPVGLGRRSAAVRLVALVVVLVPLGVGLVVSRQLDDPPLAAAVLTFRQPGPAFTAIRGADLRCRTVVGAPQGSIRCGRGLTGHVALAAREAGDAVLRQQVLELGDGQWSVVEVRPSTSPPRSGERTRLLGRLPAEGDRPAVDVAVEGTALGWRDGLIAVAVPTAELDLLAPVLALKDPPVVAVRALGRP